MLRQLPVALAQVQAGNTSENVLNEIRQIVYSLYQAKEITKKVYNNVMSSIMDTRWMLHFWPIEFVTKSCIGNNAM